MAYARICSVFIDSDTSPAVCWAVCAPVIVCCLRHVQRKTSLVIGKERIPGGLLTSVVVFFHGDPASPGLSHRPDAGRRGRSTYCPRIPAGAGHESKGHAPWMKCVSLGLLFGGWIKQVTLASAVTNGRDCSGGNGGRKCRRKEKMESRMKRRETPI